MRYKHLFFDLDHTLWDADRNSADTLEELYIRYDLQKRGIPCPADFIEKYREINEKFWEDFSKDKISKQALRFRRFLLTLRHFRINSYTLSYSMSREYVRLAPAKSKTQPHAHEVLSYLAPAYTLHILTNGFESAQKMKLKASKLDPFFMHLISSETAGSKKPGKAIFDYALNRAKANKNECLMIGDNLQADIIGARSAGIDQVYYNIGKLPHNEKVSFEITSLDELRKFL